MKSKVISAHNEVALQTQLNEFFQKNQAIEVISITQSQSDSSHGIRIILTIIYKEGN